VEILGGYLKESKKTVNTQINLQNQKVVSPFASALGYWDSLLNNMPYQRAQLTVFMVSSLIHEESLKALNKYSIVK